MLTNLQLNEVHLKAQDVVFKQYGQLNEPEGGYGACGFAWVNVYGVRKNEDKLTLKYAGFKRSECDRCLKLWVSGFGQSVEMKETYANAYAKGLETLGLKAYSGSRLD